MWALDSYSYSFQVVLSPVTDCFSQVCINKCCTEYLKGTFCRSLGISDFWYAVLWILTILAFLDFQLHFANTGSFPGSSWFPLLDAAAWKFFQGIKMRQLEVSPHMFPISQGSLSFIVWFPVSSNHCVICIVHIFGLFKRVFMVPLFWM